MKCSEAKNELSQSFVTQGSKPPSEAAIQHTRNCKSCQNYELQLKGMDDAYNRTHLQDPPIDLILRVNREYLSRSEENTSLRLFSLRNISWASAIMAGILILVFFTFSRNHSDADKDIKDNFLSRIILSTKNFFSESSENQSSHSKEKTLTHNMNNSDDDRFNRISQNLDKKVSVDIKVKDLKKNVGDEDKIRTEKFNALTDTDNRIEEDEDLVRISSGGQSNNSLSGSDNTNTSTDISKTKKQPQKKSSSVLPNMQDTNNSAIPETDPETGSPITMDSGENSFAETTDESTDDLSDLQQEIVAHDSTTDEEAIGDESSKDLINDNSDNCTDDWGSQNNADPPDPLADDYDADKETAKVLDQNGWSAAQEKYDAAADEGPELALKNNAKKKQGLGGIQESDEDSEQNNSAIALDYADYELNYCPGSPDI